MLKIVYKNIHFDSILFTFYGLICFSVVSEINGVEYYTEKPDFIKTCKIYQPEFTACSTVSIQALMQHLTNAGIPELTEKFGPIDPLMVKKIIFAQENNQAVTIAANLTDIIAKGFSKLVVKENKVNAKDFSWETKIFLPKLRLDGKYKMTGRILVIPLNGAGNIFLDIDNMDIFARTKTKLYEKAGFTFYNVTKVRVNLNITGVRANLDNIFNGNSKELERSTNRFFNENWRDFFEALRPLITQTVERILLRLLKTTFDLFPANFFIEDIPKSTELYSDIS